jgi:predicted enzyme related to lactoylglutathione lyase
LKNPGTNGLITFCYYRDLERAAEFYGEVMGFKLTRDQGWAKVFEVAENAFIGCVDGSVGYHKPSPTKPVMLTVVVDDPDAWYEHLRRHGVETLSEPHDNEKLNLRLFLLEDPEGYVIEVQKFYDTTP